MFVIGLEMTNAQQIELLTTHKIYYVDITNGIPNSDGLSPTNAFRTISEASEASRWLDVNGYNVYIQLANGNYPQSVNFRALRGGGSFVLQGNSSNPLAVHVTGGGATPPIQMITDNVRVTIRNLKLSSTTGTSPFIVGLACHGNLSVNEGVTFGYAPVTQIYVCCGGIFQVNANYTVDAGSGRHLYAIGPCHIWANLPITVTFVNNPLFTMQVVGCTEGGVLELIQFSWSGTARGQRYNASGCGSIYTGGKPTTWIPGNTNGFTGWGGVYF